MAGSGHAHRPVGSKVRTTDPSGSARLIQATADSILANRIAADVIALDTALAAMIRVRLQIGAGQIVRRARDALRAGNSTVQPAPRTQASPVGTEGILWTYATTSAAVSRIVLQMGFTTIGHVAVAVRISGVARHRDAHRVNASAGSTRIKARHVATSAVCGVRGKLHLAPILASSIAITVAGIAAQDGTDSIETLSRSMRRGTSIATATAIHDEIRLASVRDGVVAIRESRIAAHATYAVDASGL